MQWTLFAKVAILATLAEPCAAFGDDKKLKPLKELMPWYRSGDEIASQISDLASSCGMVGGEAEMSKAGEGGANLDVVRVSGIRTDVAAKTKVLLVFGEHARELITGESAVGLMQSLCTSGTSGSALAQKALAQGVEFILVPNANPKGRRQVEDGHYCKRTNENGVDLNRNWGDDHRVNSVNSPGDEMNPGPRGFSEPETQALRDLVDQEKPDVFLSVHSGAYILGSAYGYKHGEPKNKDTIDAVLRPISEKYCNGGCPYGSVSDLLLYSMEGCDIDYVSEHSGVPYAFTWEIYAGPKTRPLFDMEAKDQQKGGQILAQRQARLSRSRTGGFLQVADPRPEDQEDPQDCISEFLPVTENQTSEVVGTWAAAYVDLSLRIARKKAGSTEAPDSETSDTVVPAISSTADYIAPAAEASTADYVEPAAVAAASTSDSDFAVPAANEAVSKAPDVDVTNSGAKDVAASTGIGDDPAEQDMASFFKN